MKKINLILALVTTATLSFGGEIDGSAVVGSAIGGKQGAIIGGGAGGAIGASVGSNQGQTNVVKERVIYVDDNNGHHDNGKHKGQYKKKYDKK
jgi:uncharacterized membrane protein